MVISTRVQIGKTRNCVERAECFEANFTWYHEHLHYVPIVIRSHCFLFHLLPAPTRRQEFDKTFSWYNDISIKVRIQIAVCCVDLSSPRFLLRKLTFRFTLPSYSRIRLIKLSSLSCNFFHTGSIKRNKYFNIQTSSAFFFF